NPDSSNSAQTERLGNALDQGFRRRVPLIPTVNVSRDFGPALCVRNFATIRFHKKRTRQMIAIERDGRAAMGKNGNYAVGARGSERARFQNDRSLDVRATEIIEPPERTDLENF